MVVNVMATVKGCKRVGKKPPKKKGGSCEPKSKRGDGRWGRGYARRK